jgi:hypothetical protein
MFSANGRIRIYAGGGDAPCNGRILSCQWACNSARSLKSTNHGP